MSAALPAGPAPGSHKAAPVGGTATSAPGSEVAGGPAADGPKGAYQRLLQETGFELSRLTRCLHPKAYRNGPNADVQVAELGPVFRAFRQRLAEVAKGSASENDLVALNNAFVSDMNQGRGNLAAEFGGVGEALRKLAGVNIRAVAACGGTVDAKDADNGSVEGYLSRCQAKDKASLVKEWNDGWKQYRTAFKDAYQTYNGDEAKKICDQPAGKLFDDKEKRRRLTEAGDQPIDVENYKAQGHEAAGKAGAKRDVAAAGDSDEADAFEANERGAGARPVDKGGDEAPGDKGAFNVTEGGGGQAPPPTYPAPRVAGTPPAAKPAAAKAEPPKPANEAPVGSAKAQKELTPTVSIKPPMGNNTPRMGGGGRGADTEMPRGISPNPRGGGKQLAASSPKPVEAPLAPKSTAVKTAESPPAATGESTKPAAAPPAAPAAPAPASVPPSTPTSAAPSVGDVVAKEIAEANSGLPWKEPTTTEKFGSANWIGKAAVGDSRGISLSEAIVSRLSNGVAVDGRYQADQTRVEAMIRGLGYEQDSIKAEAIRTGVKDAFKAYGDAKIQRMSERP